MGLGWVLWRTGYEVRRRTGLLKRRFPTPEFARISLQELLRPGTPCDAGEYVAFRAEQCPRFFFGLGELLSGETLARLLGPEDRRRTLSVANAYGVGRFLYYSHHEHELGQPPNWLLNPFTGVAHGNQDHWCEHPTFSPQAGDIKDVWEPSRFACAYWLVRAYALTGEDRYAASFWSLFESWVHQNPPNRGPNWKCGQEAALRCMAWCFALWGFWSAPSTTADRVVALVRMLGFHGRRIAANIGYAISQKNNHGLSEATGLLTLGLLFPEMNDASAWVRLGRRTLEREVRRQIYDDGSYVQHSMNYHRVMLHDCLWAIRLAELNGQPLSEGLRSSVARAGRFLFEMLDQPSGRVPNHGANDGALVLPLSSCDYADYRPTVQAACFLERGGRVLTDGPWNESLAWLWGAGALAGPTVIASPTSRRFDSGGYYTLRTGNSWCMVRCHDYRDRPVHLDPMHVDLWYCGNNLLGDSGSYRYYDPAEPLLPRYFKGLRSHNTVEVDEQEPARLCSRFLWLPWPVARCHAHGPERFLGESHTYDRSPWATRHQRIVELVDPLTWRICDVLTGRGEHHLTLRWHLVDGAYRLDAVRRVLEIDLEVGVVHLGLDGPESLTLDIHRGHRAGERSIGWNSQYYADCRPRPTLVVTARCQLPTEFVTTLSLPDSDDRSKESDHGLGP